MMKSGIYYGLAAMIFVIAAADVSAQKYPERRTVRQGTKRYAKGDYSEAETKYRNALELNPEFREAAFNLGNALWRQERAQEAADAWTSIAADSLAESGLISMASYNIGNASLAGQQIDAAIEAYKAALRLRPDDMEAKFNLAYAQKLKQQQENQDNNQDQNRDQDRNNQGGGQNDQNQDPNDQNNDNNSQNRDGDGDGKNDPPNGNGNEPPPAPSEQGQGDAKIDPKAAEQMLDAMQAAEDDTREKVDAKEVQVGARSGKNW